MQCDIKFCLLRPHKMKLNLNYFKFKLGTIQKQLFENQNNVDNK